MSIELFQSNWIDKNINNYKDLENKLEAIKVRSAKMKKIIIATLVAVISIGIIGCGGNKKRQRKYKMILFRKKLSVI